LVRKFFHHLIKAVTTPLPSLLRRIRKQRSRQKKAFATNLFRSLKTGIVRIASAVTTNGPNQGNQTMLGPRNRIQLTNHRLDCMT
jgi:hypothetical protein